MNKTNRRNRVEQGSGSVFRDLGFPHVHLLERGRDAFQKQHGSLRAKHLIAGRPS